LSRRSLWLNFSYDFGLWCFILLITFGVKFIILVLSVVCVVHFGDAVE
jgi:hypothetical protein